MYTVKAKLITEKSTLLEQKFVYMFEVAKQATKHQISASIEQLYGKKPLSVTTSIRPGRIYRAGKTRSEHHGSDTKVAYVKMKESLGIISSVKA